MLDHRFSYDAFIRASDRAGLAHELAAEITRRLRAAPDPDSEGHLLADELRGLGHDLHSFDESDDFQLWRGSWVATRNDSELILDIRYASGQAPSASAAFRERPAKQRR